MLMSNSEHRQKPRRSYGSHTARDLLLVAYIQGVPLKQRDYRVSMLIFYFRTNFSKMLQQNKRIFKNR